MKPKNNTLQHLGFIALARRRSASAASLLLTAMLAAASAAHADTYYWDTNDATAGSGAPAGTWGTSAFWTTDSTGSSVTSATTTTTADDLFFSAGTNGTTGTVTVSGTQAANLITFDDNVAVTISGGTSLSLGTTGSTTAGITVASGDNANNAINTNIALGVNSTVTNIGTGTLTLGGVVSGSGFSLTSTGEGTLSLSNNNTFRGGFTLDGSKLVIGRNSAGAVGAVTSGALGTGNVTLQGGSLLASSANNVGNQKNVFNAINVDSGTTILGASTTLANLRLMGAITGSGTLSNSITGTTATSAIFGGDLSGFTGTFSYQNTNSLTNFRFGNNTGTSGSPLTGQTVDASQAQFVVNASGAITRNLALTDNIGGSTLKMGSLSGNGVVNGSFNNNGTDVQAANTYEIGALGLTDVFTGLLANNTGSNQADFNVVKTGTGSLTLSGASFYTGSTTVRDGKLIAGADVAVSTNGGFGNSSTAIALGDATTISSGTAKTPQLLTGGAFTIARAITVGANNDALGNAGTSFTIGGNTANTSTFSGVTTLNQNLAVTQVASGTLNLTGNITSGSSGTQTVTFNNAGAVSQSTGVIGGGTGTIAVTQSGSGTTTLSGANTYTGATTISAGTLAVNGNQIEATGAVTVSNSGTRLIGTGTLGANTTTISSGAIHSSGGAVANVDKVGLQTFDQTLAATSDLTYGAGSIFEWDLNANSNLSGDRGTGYDGVNVTGTLAVDSTSIFRVVLGSGVASGTFWQSTQTWANIFDGGFALSGSGFNNSLLEIVNPSGGVYDPSTLNPGYQFTVSGTTLTWSAVPEPSTAMIGLLVTAGLLRRRRKN